MVTCEIWPCKQITEELAAVSTVRQNEATLTPPPPPPPTVYYTEAFWVYLYSTYSEDSCQDWIDEEWRHVTFSYVHFHLHRL